MLTVLTVMISICCRLSLPWIVSSITSSSVVLDSLNTINTATLALIDDSRTTKDAPHVPNLMVDNNIVGILLADCCVSRGYRNKSGYAGSMLPFSIEKLHPKRNRTRSTERSDEWTKTMSLPTQFHPTEQSKSAELAHKSMHIRYMRRVYNIFID